MENKRRVLRQFMLILRNLDADEVKLKGLEPVYKDGSVAGYRIEVEAKKKPKLKLVEEDKD